MQVDLAGLKNLFYTKAPASTLRSPVPKAGPAYGSIFSLFNSSGLGGLFFKSGEVDFQAAVQMGYKSNVWIYRCLSLVAGSIGSVPWEVYRGKNRVQPDDPFQRLLDRPNAYQDRKEFFYAASLYLNLGGNDFMEIVSVSDRIGKNAKQVPASLYHIRPDWMRPKVAEDGTILSYTLDNKQGRKPIEYEPQEILHMMYLDPLDPYYGQSPLQCLGNTLETDAAMTIWNKAVLANYAMPGGVLTVPAALVPDDRAELKEEIEREFSGENLSKPMVLWGGMEWKQISLSHENMQFTSQREASKTDICAATGVPANLVGAIPDPTYSNFKTSRLAFWEDRIVTELEWFQSKLNMCIAPRFGPEYSVKFNISGVAAFRELFDQKVESGQKLFTMGWPINAINDRLDLGLKPVPWGDSAWLPMSLQPITKSEPMELPLLPGEISNSDPNDEGLPHEGNEKRRTKPVKEAS